MYTDMLLSQSNIRIVCFAALVLHGVYTFSVRLFYPVSTQTALGKGQIKSYYMVLISTAVCGVAIWLDGVDMQNASNKLLIALIPWVITILHDRIIYIHIYVF